MRWTCPECDREFGRTNQPHVCVPGITMDECFARWPAWQRTACDALVEHVEALGPVHLDVVRVGVILKRDVSFAEIRPRARSLELSMFLPRAVADARIVRRIEVSRLRTVHVVKILGAEVDDMVLDWLAEAYHSAT